MKYVQNMVCLGCGEQYPVEPINVCEMCFGPLEISYDYMSMKNKVTRETIQNGPPTIWRYIDFLPVNPDFIVDIGTGMTPLIKAENLGKELGLTNLYIKNDGVNPTFSFKDRPVSITTSKAKEFGFEVLACVSTGNLMGSVAAHGARANMETYVFYPNTLEKAKILQTSSYAPTLIALEGTYDDANRFCTELSDNNNWAFVNINMRAFYAEGSKTLGYEIAEQLDWQAPDHCIIPAASGELVTKIWKGLQEFSEIGIISPPENTQLHLAQAEGCSPIVQAFNNGTSEVKPVKPNTIAKSLAIGTPASGSFAIESLNQSHGTATAASEASIIENIKLLARTEGIYTETAGGVVISVLQELVKQNKIQKDDLTVAFMTGNGLKTQEIFTDTITEIKTSPKLKDFEKSLLEHKNKTLVST